MTKLSDQWQTPIWLFDELNAEFNFDIDLCATEDNSKCMHYYEDYLNNKLASKTHKTIKDRSIKEIVDVSQISAAFCNPPYSNPKPFIEKAWEDSKHCKIVCLVKADPSTQWWATFWDYIVNFLCPFCNNGYVEKEYSECAWTTGKYKEICRDCRGNYKLSKSRPKPGCEVRFFPKRIQFDPPQQLIDSGEVWKIGSKWVQICKECPAKNDLWEMLDYINCMKCNDKGYKELSGPTFSSALLIFNRRGL